MGRQLAYTDAYARSVEARVMSVDSSGPAPLVMLDRTVFYPRGGGQPADLGRLTGGDGMTWRIRVAGYESKGRINKRIRLALGDGQPA